MLIRYSSIVGGVAAALLMSSAPMSWAGPQDSPPSPPPVQVTAGADRFLSDSTYSLTLSADGSAGQSGLEPGQVQQAVQAAASGPSTAAGTTVSAGSADDSTATPGGAGGSATGPERPGAAECRWRAADVPAGDSRWGANDPASGTLVMNTCNGGDAQYVYVPDSALPPAAVAVPPPPPDPAVLAQQARTELTLPTPTVRRSPPETNSDPDNGGLPYTWVGLSTFYWVEGWQPMTRTVELRGVSATVTATPTGLTFDPGDGSAAVSCAGPGRPWTPADGDNPPSGGACGYTYRSVTPNGPLTATTSVQWSVNWTSNTGATGTFPASTTSSSSSFLVEQIQVVVR